MSTIPARRLPADYDSFEAGALMSASPSFLPLADHSVIEMSATMKIVFTSLR